MTEARRPRLNRARILAAAVRLVDRDGLAALSMRRLGQELGVEGMALYKHFPSKDALLDGMAGAILAEMAIPPADGAHWRESGREVARAYRRVAHAHPNVFPIVAARSLNSPEALRPWEATLAILDGAGLPEEMVLPVFWTVSSFVVGFVLREITAPSLVITDLAQPQVDFAAIPPETYPRVAALASRLATRRADADADFEFGLDLILAGISELVAGEPCRSTEPVGRESSAPPPPPAVRIS